MNARILELAEQATKVYEPDWNGGERLYEFDKQKFAELIIRECLDILEDEDTHDIYGQPIRLATIRIKKQFGVEE